MGIIKLASVFIFCFLSNALLANGDSVLLLKQERFLAGNYTNFYADNFGNIFLLNANNRIKKINEIGDSLSVFNDTRRYGDIYLLDVNNPLKILAYYKDFSTIVVLDRFLNAINTIDLRNSGILQATAVAQSYDNYYWVFDELENKLKKVDDKGNVLFASADFRILFSDAYLPSAIIDQNGLLFLYNQQQGWKIFDYYGAFKQNLAYTNWKDVDASNKVLYGTDSVFMYSADIKIPREQKIRTNIDLATAIKVQQQPHKIFVLKQEGLYIYSHP